MCELHFYKCACGKRWTAVKRLSSCDEDLLGPTETCPPDMCMHVGDPKKPRRRECEKCREVREMLEEMEEEEEGGGDGS
jgi:hypothetical protein